MQIGQRLERRSTSRLASHSYG